jgi:hypothetical protein
LLTDVLQIPFHNSTYNLLIIIPFYDWDHGSKVVEVKCYDLSEESLCGFKTHQSQIIEIVHTIVDGIKIMFSNTKRRKDFSYHVELISDFFINCENAKEKFKVFIKGDDDITRKKNNLHSLLCIFILLQAIKVEFVISDSDMINFYSSLIKNIHFFCQKFNIVLADFCVYGSSYLSAGLDKSFDEMAVDLETKKKKKKKKKTKMKREKKKTKKKKMIKKEKKKRRRNRLKVKKADQKEQNQQKIQNNV